MMKNGLGRLEDSLVKKKGILERLHIILEKQYVILQAESMDAEAFDACVEEQDVLVEELNVLDAGFEGLLENVKEELACNKEQYTNQIVIIQDLNRTVQKMCSSLQEKETRNKELLTSYLQNEKMSFGAGRRSSKAAYDYYKNMSQSNVVPPQFMDKKK